ncbi:glycosyltransferase family 4 protein [Halovivax limisalsi]|uniref:glycosyltransferase family 4 protein n=1 Tax=Halovivax limisalsi TaxID=1453760 RepID=UPI001FFD4BAF|nr:glycosyltransferase family 4 protein [Halovivax limisalsi]
MRILLAAHALPPATRGGTELYTVRLAEKFAARGHAVTVAAPRGADATVEGATVVELPDAAPRPEDGVGLSRAAGVEQPEIDDAVSTLFDEGSSTADIVHLQHFKGLSSGIPSLCADRGVPCIATLHDFWTLCHREQLRKPDGTPCSGPTSIAKCAECYADAVARFAAESSDGTDAERIRPGLESGFADAVARRTRGLRRALGDCDRLVSPSRYLRDVFVDFGFDSARIVHRRNGIRTDEFRGSTFDADTPLQIGYAGRIAESKGVHLLVEALDHISADVDLHVHGSFSPDEEPYHASLRDAARRIEGSAERDRIRFHGSYPDAPAVFDALDVFVLPSIWVENSPLVIQEAFAAGVPVVTGDRGGMAELVTHGDDGLTVPVGDVDALAEALERLAVDPELVRRLRAGVEPPTELDDHATELLALYREQLRADGSDESGGRPEGRNESGGRQSAGADAAEESENPYGTNRDDP